MHCHRDSVIRCFVATVTVFPTTPTGAGPVVGGVVAGGASFVSRVASGVAFFGYLANGDQRGMIQSGIGVAVGMGASRAATSFLLRGRAFGNLSARGASTANLAGSTVSAVGGQASVCN